MKFKIHILFALFFSSSLFAQEVLILGTAQDAGKPQLGCEKSCCSSDTTRGLVVSMAILDSTSKRYMLLEATPDITEQIRMIPKDYEPLPSLVMLTHAHIGHYTGLMYFGREAANANRIPLLCGPRMANFLLNNGPWSQLFELNNLRFMAWNDSTSNLANANLLKRDSNLRILPFRVPHRDEFSETLGYFIAGPQKSILFIPDIDKWEAWEQELGALLPFVDYAFIDGTFYDGKELPGRDMSEIPHPFVVETMARYDSLPPQLKAKIYFIHFNHTNPLWDPQSAESKEVLERGFKIARRGQSFKL